MNLNKLLISAPLSSIYTIVLCASMYVVFCKLGRKVFMKNDAWANTAYFLSGLAIFSATVFLLCLAGFTAPIGYQIIAILFLLSSVAIIFLGKCKFLLPVIPTRKYAWSNKQKLLTFCIAVCVLSLIIIALSPPTDSDSLDYHLGIPLQIIKGKTIWYDPNQLHFRMIGLGEMLNLFGLANGCAQLGAAIQLIVYFSFANVIVDEAKGKNKNLTLILFFCLPLLLFLVPSQKHQLTGAACTALCFFIIMKQKGELDLATLVLLSICICFAAMLKYSFIISAGVLVLYLLLKLDTAYKRIQSVFILIGVSIVIVMPLLFYRYVHFGDPLSPLLETLKSKPDPVIIKFHHFLQEYRDADFPFPLNVLLPSSLGTISTILGYSVFIIILLPFYASKHKVEIFLVVLFVMLMAVLGQRNARFFIEPYLWIIPILINSSDNNIAKWLILGSRIQFFLLLPFFFFAVWVMGKGVVSNTKREDVLVQSGLFYQETKWMDKILPAGAVICTDIRSRSLLKHPFFPVEYIYFSDLNDKVEARTMDSMIKQYYKVKYIVISDDTVFNDFKAKYAGEIIAGPEKFIRATRNPFNKKEYTATIYTVK